MIKNFKFQKGQSVVLLVFFVMAAVAISVAAIFMLVVGSGSTTDFHNGIEISQLADSAAEDALLKLERDPDYQGGSYKVGGADVVSVITGDTVKTISIRAVSGDFSKRLEVLADYNNNVLRVTSWKEVY